MFSNYAASSALTTTQSAGDDAALAVFVLFLLFALIVGGLIFIFMIVAQWKIFEKAGEPGWAALIPYYSQWKLFEISGKPGWWALVPLAAYLPIVGLAASIAALVLAIIGMVALAKSFGKSTGFAVLLVLLPPVGLGILAFSRDAQYIGPGGYAVDDITTMGTGSSAYDAGYTSSPHAALENKPKYPAPTDPADQEPGPQ